MTRMCSLMRCFRARTHAQGEVRRNRKLRVGMYHQHFADLLDFEKTPVQYLVDKYDKKYQEVRNKLGKFGLEGHAHTIPVGQLSGGQKARVVFAGVLCVCVWRPLLTICGAGQRVIWAALVLFSYLGGALIFSRV